MEERNSGKTAHGGKAHTSGGIDLKTRDRKNPTYIVKSGDTLKGIANRLRVSYQELLKTNGITDSNFIKAGDPLLIPRKTAPPSASSSTVGNSHIHTDSNRPGDTLRHIAQKHRAGTTDLLTANPTLNPGKVKVGVGTIIPGSAAHADKRAVNGTSTGHGHGHETTPTSSSNANSRRPSRKEINVLSKEFINQVESYARDLNIKPEWLLACMHFETSGTFSPTIRNRAGSGAVGLIQFTRIAVQDLNRSREPHNQITLDDVGKFNRIQQLKLVHDYFKIQIKRHGPIASFEDCYMAILCPGAIGKKSDYVLYKSGKAYTQNANLDFDKNGRITKQEATERARNSLKLLTE